MSLVSFACFVLLWRALFGAVRECFRRTPNFYQSIRQERFTVFPDPGLVGVQNDRNNFVPVSERGAYQHLLCGPRVPGFEPIASGKMPQQTIMIPELLHDPGWRSPGVIDRSHDLSKKGLLHGCSRDQSQIMRRRVVGGIVQSVWIRKMAVCRAKFRRSAIHFFSKRFDGARIISS